ncbi:protein FEZ-like [Nicotiana sylvestris]|uniref:protein FEZ-like n=1 Tax=Nicotiana sylvestris TaxID=4096 RepID=UPI00388CC3F0
MREFRLPTTNIESVQPKKFLDRNFPPNDSWAICRIFKKANSMENRALSYSWINPLSEVASPEVFNQSTTFHFGSQNISSLTETGSLLHLSSNNDLVSNVPSCKILNTMVSRPSFLSSPSTEVPCSNQQMNSFSMSSSQDMQRSIGMENDEAGLRTNQDSTNVNITQWENIRSIGFPFSLTTSLADEWKTSLSWNSPSCPSEISTTYDSTNKCYT